MSAAILALVALAAFAGAMLVRPEAATLLVVFLLFVNGPAVAVNDHGAPLLFGAVFPFLLALPIAQATLRGEPLVVDRTFAVVLALFAVQIASTITAEHQDAAFEQLQTTAIEGVLLYLLLVNAVRTRETLRRCAWMLLAAAAALSLITVFQKVTGRWTSPMWGFGKVNADFFTGRNPNPRAAGPLGDPNYYAQILLVAASVGLIRIWDEARARWRTAAIACTALAVVATMITASRGAAMALVVVLVVMAFLGHLKAKHAVSIVVGLVLLVSFVPEYKERLLTLENVSGATAEAGTDPMADQSAASRTTEMLAAAMVFADHPVLGVGPDGFPFYYQDYARRLALPVHENAESGARKGEEAQRQSHNMFLSVAADLGVLGVVAFCAVIVSAAWGLLRGRRRARARGDSEMANLTTAFLLGIVAYAASGLFLTLAFERYFWLLLGLAGAATVIALRPEPRGAAVVRG